MNVCISIFFYFPHFFLKSDMPTVEHQDFCFPENQISDAKKVQEMDTHYKQRDPSFVCNLPQEVWAT